MVTRQRTQELVQGLTGQHRTGVPAAGAQIADLVVVPVIAGASFTAVTFTVRVLEPVPAPARSELASVTVNVIVRASGSVAELAFGLSDVFT